MLGQWLADWVCVRTMTLHYSPTMGSQAHAILYIQDPCRLESKAHLLYERNTQGQRQNNIHPWLIFLIKLVTSIYLEKNLIFVQKSDILADNPNFGLDVRNATLSRELSIHSSWKRQYSMYSTTVVPYVARVQSCTFPKCATEAYDTFNGLFGSLKCIIETLR